MPYVVCRQVDREGGRGGRGGALRRRDGPARRAPSPAYCSTSRTAIPRTRRVFFFYEQYADEAAYQAHVDSPHFQATGFGDAIPRLETRQREFYRTIHD